jgi:hypothetical protein
MAGFDDLPPTNYDDEVEPGSRDYSIIQWCEARLAQGKAFVESSPGYDKIESALNAVFAEENADKASYAPSSKGTSKTRVNLIAKTAEDLTALLTDMRVFWDYSTYNPKYEKQTRLSNQGAESWFITRLIGLRIADLVRYYTVAGTGFLHMFYSRRLDDIMVDALDPRCVFPVEPLSYHTVQDALGVIIRTAKTPSWVKAEYGKDVAPDQGSAGVFGWLTRVIKAVKDGGPLTKRGEDKAIPGGVPTVFVNTMYLDDKRVNKKSTKVYMGDWDDGKPQNQWSYEVKPGQALYPFKRMIVWCTGHLLYDGPSPYWHAMFPVIKLTLNPWPKSWLGKAPLHDLLPLNVSMNGLLRVVDDHAAQIAQPAVIGDRNVSRAEMNKFDSRTPGAKIRTNMASGKGLQIVPPPPLDAGIWKHIEWIETMMQKLSGTADMSQMASLAQIPSADTVDTLMKAMTPGNRLRSRILEGFMVEFAQMYLFNQTEFDTLTKRVAKFGPSAATPEDFDYEPGTFIPDDVPDGEPGDVADMLDALQLDEPRPLYVRATEMLKSIAYKFKSGSLLNSAAMQDIMQDFMLAKMGYLSYFTLMEKLGKSNVFPPSLQVPDDELGRLALQQQLGIGMIANSQGRKASDSAPPSMQQGSNGPTITTS